MRCKFPAREPPVGRKCRRQHLYFPVWKEATSRWHIFQRKDVTRNDTASHKTFPKIKNRCHHVCSHPLKDHLGIGSWDSFQLRDRSFAWGKTYCPSLANCYEATAGCPTTQLRLTRIKRGHKTSRGIWEWRDTSTVRTLPKKLTIWPCLNEDSNHCCDFAII